MPLLPREFIRRKKRTTTGMKIDNESTTDPQYHVTNIHGMLGDVMNHCREDSARVSEPKAQALFETTAEVLQGLRTAYQHYTAGSEPAMEV